MTNQDGAKQTHCSGYWSITRHWQADSNRLGKKWLRWYTDSFPSLTEANTYTVVVAAKTTSIAYETTPFPPDPNSSKSTINTVEREIREAGGDATAVPVDVRYTAQIENLVKETVRIYGSLDVLVYNSGAIWWSSVENTPTKRFQLMQKINPEGLYASVQASLPEFAKNGWKERIIVVSPPIYSRFFRGKTAYAMGMFIITAAGPEGCG